MGIIRTTLKVGVLGFTGGVAGVGAGIAYLSASIAVVDLPRDNPWSQSKTYRKFNPKGNPALEDDCIKRVPLSAIRPELRNDEKALTLEFCRGIWSRWGFWAQSKLQQRYDAPPGSEDNKWTTAELAVAEYQRGLRFSNHFEVVENEGNEITVRCGGSPMNPGLRSSDGLILFSARVDKEKQEAVFSMKSALFDSAGTYAQDASHAVPPKIVFLHRLYVRMLVQSAMSRVKA